MSGNPPFTYTVVCGWNIPGAVKQDSQLEQHASLLVVESDEPWDGKAFPYEYSDINKLSNMEKMDLLSYLGTPFARQEALSLDEKKLFEDLLGLLSSKDEGRINQGSIALVRNIRKIEEQKRESIDSILNDCNSTANLTASNIYLTEDKISIIRDYLAEQSQVNLSQDLKERFKHININLENADQLEIDQLREIVNFTSEIRKFEKEKGEKVDSALIKLQGKFKVKDYISTNTVSAVHQFEREAEYFTEKEKGVPGDWVVLPESVNDSPGVNTTKLHKWWVQISKAKDAFAFKAIKYPMVASDAKLQKRAKEIFEAPKNKEQYILFSLGSPAIYKVAYKDNQNEIQLYTLQQSEINKINKFKDIKYKGDHPTGINKSLSMRDCILSIAKNFPNHEPVVTEQEFNKHKYQRYWNNCSHLVRNALTEAGVHLKKYISTPRGLLKDSHDMIGQCSPNLLSFVNACIVRMESDDIKYKPNSRSSKLEEFKRLRDKMQASDDNPNKYEDEVKSLAKQHRSSGISNKLIKSDTAKAFKAYKKQMDKIKREASPELETEKISIFEKK